MRTKTQFNSTLNKPYGDMFADPMIFFSHPIPSHPIPYNDHFNIFFKQFCLRGDVLKIKALCFQRKCLLREANVIKERGYPSS